MIHDFVSIAAAGHSPFGRLAGCTLEDLIVQVTRIRSGIQHGRHGGRQPRLGPSGTQELNMNIANWLADASQRCPERPALFEGARQVANYGTFAALVRHRAAYLINDHGIVPGDRIALFMPNCCEYLELLYAIWWVGAVTVPINYDLPTVEASYIVGDAQARLIVTDDGQLFPRNALPPGCRELDREDMGALTSMVSPLPNTPYPRLADDLAWLFYTSGTTGRSKGVMLSHGNLATMSLRYPLNVDPISAEEAVVYAAPMSQGAGLNNFIHVRRAARHVVPDSRGFNAEELFELASRLGNVSMFATPAMLKRMVGQTRRQGYRCLLDGWLLTSANDPHAGRKS